MSLVKKGILYILNTIMLFVWLYHTGSVLVNNFSQVEAYRKYVLPSLSANNGTCVKVVISFVKRDHKYYPLNKDCSDGCFLLLQNILI